VLTWGKPDPKKCELVIEDCDGEAWEYIGPLVKFRAETDPERKFGPNGDDYERAVATKISTGDKYTGKFRDGKFYDHQATLEYANGDRLKSAYYKAGVLTEGSKVSKTGTYDGYFKNNKYHGKGRLTMKNGDMYEGEFVAGQKHGMFETKLQANNFDEKED